MVKNINNYRNIAKIKVNGQFRNMGNIPFKGDLILNTKPFSRNITSDYFKPSLYRRGLHKISNPKLDYEGNILNIPKYYNRGRFRFVYLFGKDRKHVIKIFKHCWPLNICFGPYYDKAYKENEKKLGRQKFQFSAFENKTLRESLALSKVDEETYVQALKYLSKRIIKTQFGIIKKYGFGIPSFHPYVIQPYVTGKSLYSLAKKKIKIRENMLDDSYNSLYGHVLNFKGVNKYEILNGIEEFLGLFEKLYNDESAVFDFSLSNLVFNKMKGLVCYDVQKFHENQFGMIKGDYNRPKDCYHTLKNILDVNE